MKTDRYDRVQCEAAVAILILRILYEFLVDVSEDFRTSRCGMRACLAYAAYRLLIDARTQGR